MLFFLTRKGKKIRKKQIILVKTIRNKKLHLANWICLFKMRCKRCNKGYLPITNNENTYVYKEEYDKNKKKLKKVID